MRFTENIQAQKGRECPEDDGEVSQNNIRLWVKGTIRPGWSRDWLF